MASATAIASPDGSRPDVRPEPRQPDAPRRVSRWRFWSRGSRLGRLIVGLNLIGLAVLISGALVLNEIRRGLVEARLDSLSLQGELIGQIMAEAATQGEPTPYLQADRAARILQLLHVPRSQRVRLYDTQGRLLADSYVVDDRVEWQVLPPARKRGEAGPSFRLQDADADPAVIDKARKALAEEWREAILGESVRNTRIAENGDTVVSVSIPIQRVKAVLGVLTLEAGDVDEIIAAERRALIPFALIAIAVTLLSSVLLYALVARPMLRLAEAADRVRLNRSRAIRLPDLARRQDEIGDLSRSLEEMTDTLSTRMDAIERFAADVAHEIRNPLTSIRSAVETLEIVPDGQGREKLLGILKQDVGRLDRLIGDISNASRLDAELSRESFKRFDLTRLLTDILSIYDAARKPGEARVSLIAPEGETVIAGQEGPLGQVVRNLIDNARSFSPPDGEVRVTVVQEKGRVLVEVEDDGPGIPADNLETVFERFYTARPKGAAFGGNSGLGLSIARQITLAHGGSLMAHNRTDDRGRVVGARFELSLPAGRS
ncbi:MAG: stimulus-sensing domain-containing protein [Caulobacter sp.]|nr:stimulus-sensing domain-containing protein [Caulobacter sp.]